MKTIRVASLLTFSLLASSCCFASIMVEVISQEQAEKDYGATIRTTTVATNQVSVSFEFIPKGKLTTYESVQLDILSGQQTIVSTRLALSKPTTNTVGVYFSTDPAYLSTSKLIVYYKISSGFPPYDGIEFNVGDFINEPIERLVAKFSSGQVNWHRGSFRPASYTSSASDQEVAEYLLQPYGTFHILEIRKVHIPVGSPEIYTAVLADTEKGKMVVIMRYEGQIGWWNHIYSAE